MGQTAPKKGGDPIAWVARAAVLPPSFMLWWMRGRPLRLMLSAGQAYDGHAALDLLDAQPPGSQVLADRA